MTAFFADNLARFGDAPAFICEDGSRLSYLDLVNQINAFTRQLPQARALVLIETTNEPAPLIAYLACLKAHHPVILCAEGTLMKDQRLATQFRPQFIYCKSETGWTLTDTGAPPAELHGDLSLLLSTSGSTGSAKLVRLSRDNIAANAASIVSYLDIKPDDRAITSLPWHYSYGLSVIHSHLSVGAALVLTDLSVTDENFWQLFANENCTSFAGVPYTFELLEQNHFFDRHLPHLRTVTQAGGRLAPEKVQAWEKHLALQGKSFFVMYGQTEATARMGWLPPQMAADYPDHIGLPIPGGSFSLETDDGELVTTNGEEGELVYTGPNVMMGYAETIADLALPKGTDTLRTGDMAVRNEAGLYRITGRKSRFSKLFGLRINLDEIEHWLGKQGFPVAVAGNDQTIAICHNTDSIHLLDFLTHQYDLPRSVWAFYQAADPPRLANGKTDYQTVLQNAQAAEPQKALSLAEQMSALLGRPATDEDSFTSLEGDSLSYVQASLTIEEYLGFLPQKWETQSFAELEVFALPQADAASAVPSLDTDIALRAGAILLVVAHHAGLISFAGGAMTLLMLAGYNCARFFKSHLVEGRGHQVVLSALSKIILPYYVLLLAFLSYKQAAHLPSLLLATNFLGDFSDKGNFLTPYWFLEVYIQLLILLWLVCLVPPVRRYIKAHPFRTGLTGIVLSFAAFAFSSSVTPQADHLPHHLLFIFLFGWCLYVQRATAHKWILTGLALWLFPFSFGLDNTVGWIVSGASLLLLWQPRFAVPALMKKAVMPVGAASFYIYLLHTLPVHVFRYELDWQNTLLTGGLALVLSVIAGIVVERLIKFISRQANKVSSPSVSASLKQAEG